jgi:hypothetical protein
MGFCFSLIEDYTGYDLSSLENSKFEARNSKRTVEQSFDDGTKQCPACQANFYDEVENEVPFGG